MLTRLSGRGQHKKAQVGGYKAHRSLALSPYLLNERILLPLSLAPRAIEVSQCSDKRRIEDGGRHVRIAQLRLTNHRVLRGRPRRRSRCNSREGCQPRAIVPLGSLVVTDSSAASPNCQHQATVSVAELASRVRGKCVL